MLRISKMTDYGALVMSALARGPLGVQNAADLAGITHLPTPTVSKLLKLLAKRDLVESVRGPQGGYRLARGASEISMADIITALEGPIALTQCATHDSNCGIEHFCGTRSHWQVINRAIKKTLDELTLAEMAGPVRQVRNHLQTHLQPLTRMAPGTH